MHRLALPVSYARRVIATGIEPDASQLPSVEQISELNCVQQIIPDQLNDDHAAQTDAQVRTYFRSLFGIPDGDRSITFNVAGVRRGLVVGEEFVEHPIQVPRRRDADHMLYAPLAPMTIKQATEIWLQRAAGGGRSFVFLGVYVDRTDVRDRYAYHVAYGRGDGQITSSYRLSGGAQDFRNHRKGQLLYASYAEPVSSALVAVA